MSVRLLRPPAKSAAAAVARPIARYADRFHAELGSGHHIASPACAWLLLALAGPAATGQVRDELTEALGVDIDTALAAASAMLEAPHPLIAAGAAVWHRPRAVTAGLTAWLNTVPPAVETGSVPTQERADAWAAKHTDGMIDAFPLKMDPAVLLVLASALATRVKWESEFEVVPAAALGPASAWAQQLTRVLRARDSHDKFIATTERAGDVAVHTAAARGGLQVTSVIAAPQVPPRDVLAAAHEVAIGTAAGDGLPRRSLFTLPLGDGPAWSLTEERVPMADPSGRQERVAAFLPAWSARSGYDLLASAALGFPGAGAALAALLPPNPEGHAFAARQAVKARYERTGFEAAAVSALSVRPGSAPQRLPDGLRRTAELRFGHPFAAIATITDKRDRTWRRPVGRPWHGVPVFSAWVADPDDVTDEVSDR